MPNFFLMSGFAVIRPSEEVNTNLAFPLALRSTPHHRFLQVSIKADNDRQDHFSLSDSGKAGRRWYGSPLQGWRLDRFVALKSFLHGKSTVDFDPLSPFVLGRTEGARISAFRFGAPALTSERLQIQKKGYLSRN